MTQTNPIPTRYQPDTKLYMDKQGDYSRQHDARFMVANPTILSAELKMAATKAQESKSPRAELAGKAKNW